MATRPNVADLYLCKQLYVISGWGDTVWSWYCDEAADDDPALNLSEPLKVIGGVGYYDHQYPAYDLAYLAGMLPGHHLIKRGNESYIARWFDYSDSTCTEETSRTNPTNALARLAIALFRAGVLLTVN